MLEKNKLNLCLKSSIIIGILFILLGIVSIFLGEYQYAYSKIITGLIFILIGSLFRPVIRWKNMPKGMKIIVILLWFVFFSSLWKIYKNIESYDILLGFPLQFPLSALVKIIAVLIPLFILIAIYGRMWGSLVIGLQGFNIVNYLASAVWMIVTPLNKLFNIMGAENQVMITPQVESLTKLFMLIPISIGLIIGIIIWIYFLNRKDYFKN